MKEESEKVDLKLNIQKTKIMASVLITSWQIDGETMETVRDFIFEGFQNHHRLWLQPWNWKTLPPWKKSYDQPRKHIKKQRHYFANKDPPSQSYGFSSSHVWMWELDHKESWVLKNWCFWTGVEEDSCLSLEHQGDQNIGVSALASVLPKNTQDWSPLGWTGWIFLKSRGLSRVFSNTTIQKHQFFGTQLSL